MLLNMKEDSVYYFNDAAKRILDINSGFTSVSQFRAESQQTSLGAQLFLSKQELKQFKLKIKDSHNSAKDEFTQLRASNSGSNLKISFKKVVYQAIEKLRGAAICTVNILTPDKLQKKADTQRKRDFFFKSGKANAKSSSKSKKGSKFASENKDNIPSNCRFKVESNGKIVQIEVKLIKYKE